MLMLYQFKRCAGKRFSADAGEHEPAAIQTLILRLVPQLKRDLAFVHPGAAFVSFG
jgi:hypothetical protein